MNLFMSAAAAMMILTWLYSRHRRIRRCKQHIRDSYGKVPLGKYKDYVAYYSDNNKGRHSLDDVTWNDLNMNEVFNRINHCSSFIGEQYLYDRLHCTEGGTEGFERLTDLFSNDEVLREKVQYLLTSIGKSGKGHYLPDFMSAPSQFLLPKIGLYRFMSILLLISVPFAIIFGHLAILVTLCIFLVNGVLYAFGKHDYERHMEVFEVVSKVVALSKKITGLHEIAERYMDDEVRENIRKMQKSLGPIEFLGWKKNAVASGDIGGLMIDYILGSTLIDYHVFQRTMKSLEKNRSVFESLYCLIGEVDSAVSISSFRESLPFYCIPEFKEATSIVFEDVYHILIDEPVRNDAELDRNMIITGSNASGKSTYAKAIALNMILGLSINTCAATRAELMQADIVTSMAVRDDIISGESYYVKEINYIKRILDHITPNRLTVCVIDEILRGTNTTERIAASKAILEYLNKKNCKLIVASHDAELGRLLEESFRNIHFTEVMTEDDIQFDYKVKEGITGSRNAIKLLDHVGFPKEIVEQAIVYAGSDLY